jgi:hypothetical protein
MLGLCEIQKNSSCLYLMIRNNASYFAFYANDCIGKTIVLPQRWHHFAFVYDYPLQTQYIYLNGRIECTNPFAPPFRASKGVMTIGTIIHGHNVEPVSFWTGYIDQVSYVSQVKSAAEILTDATLVAYYPFDHATDYHLDAGPQKMHGVSDNMKIEEVKLVLNVT